MLGVRFYRIDLVGGHDRDHVRPGDRIRLVTCHVWSTVQTGADDGQWDPPIAWIDWKRPETCLVLATFDEPIHQMRWLYVLRPENRGTGWVSWSKT